MNQSETPHVIILSGVGRVGKSSTARAMKAIARVPLHVSMDAFNHMVPEHPTRVGIGFISDQRLKEGT